MLDKAKLEVAHIDYEIGVKRFAGKTDLYEKYLLKFLEDTHYQEAKEAMEQKDYEGILKLVHAMKGMTGTLGMEKLFELCSTVVSDIRENREMDVEGHFNSLSEEYNYIISVINEMK